MMVIRLAYLAFFGTSLLLLASCNKAANPSQSVQLTIVNSTSIPFEINGVKAPSDPSQITDYLEKLKIALYKRSYSAPVLAYTDIIMYSSIACQADWNVKCQGDYPFTAPPGMQMCKMLYTVTSTNNSSALNYTPSGWFEGDSEHPPRFRTYGLHIEATGSGNPINRYGSNITISNVGIRIIPATFINSDRYYNGCDTPTK
jgi:hypothetical protein